MRVSPKVTGVPSRKTFPSDGFSSPQIKESNVDLPHPDGPTTARNSPGATVNDILESVSEKYCKNCDRKGICWNKELSSTRNAVAIMMKKGIEMGEIYSEDLPRNFLIRCKNIQAILLEVNAGLRLEKNNLRWVQVVHDIKDIMSMQMLELAESLFKFNEK